MKVPDIIKQAARDLRKNMTNAEKTLWEKIRRKKILGRQFHKQKPIFVMREGSGLDRLIIADFVCLSEKLVIEIDGSVHSVPEVLELDKQKEILLEKRGYRVLRFRNEEVNKNMEGVLGRIKKEIS